MQKNNSIWQFFASVKLALVILFLITVTSIIGTVIPQKESAEFYINNFGPQMAQLFAVLDIGDMYNSWWFTALLFLLAFNLIICSLDRFPGVWKQVTADGLRVPPARLQKMAKQRTWQTSINVSQTVHELEQRLAKKGFNAASAEIEGQTLLFSQKGHWSRTGVYIVHASILIIFIGAIIGSLGGFKGSVLIPETMERNKVFLFGNKGTAELDFTIRCNSFAIDFYPNGMPKEYTSSLTVLENGREVLTKTIEVNDPLTYKGITFYQSSYEAYQDFVIVITNTSTGQSRRFISGFQKQTEWPEENLSFGVINAKAIGQSIVTSKLWFSDNIEEPTTHWIEDDETATIERGAASYEVSVKQMYATGLQVAKDPGVWWVYVGCGLMLFGLYVAFFMSHRRIWVLVTPTRKGSEVLLAGSSNKNRAGFETSFEELATLLHTGADQETDKRPAL
jgi:cytochrome c biogenesis protein